MITYNDYLLLRNKVFTCNGCGNDKSGKNFIYVSKRNTYKEYYLYDYCSHCIQNDVQIGLRKDSFVNGTKFINWCKENAGDDHYTGGSSAWMHKSTIRM